MRKLTSEFIKKTRKEMNEKFNVIMDSITDKEWESLVRGHFKKKVKKRPSLGGAD